MIKLNEIKLSLESLFPLNFYTGVWALTGTTNLDTIFFPVFANLADSVYECRFCGFFTGLLQQFKHAARGFIGDGRFALHLVLPRCIPGSNLVFGLHQNQSGLIDDLEDLLGLALVQLLADAQL